MKRVAMLIVLCCALCTTLFAQNAVKPRLAVVEFSTNASTDKIKRDTVTVRELVESEMVKAQKYQIITREDIDKLLENQRIQVSSISSSENLKKLQLQNISYIVTGSVSAMENDYAITVRVLDVSTGQFSHSDNDFMGNSSRELYNGINTLMKKFIAGMSTDESGDIVQGANKGAGKTYKVGDVGPAGGIVFFDRGFTGDGWRYLEAAPASAVFSAQWGPLNLNVNGTKTVVGYGKRNTQIIVDRLRQLRENDCAAQICANMNINNYTDWFLPSLDELNLMYRNLKQKGLGNFTNDQYWYWSSSQDSNNDVFFYNFSDGSHSASSHISSLDFSGNRCLLLVRAVRAF